MTQSPTQKRASAAHVGANEYGYFDEAAREYVITRPDTPTPWLNYIGEGRYGGIVSNTGGGYSFDRDPRNRRVTRYRYNSIPVDQPGRYVYLRDQETGEYWSPTASPVQRDLDSYECRHGTAYTRISSTYRGIAAEMLYFVPLSPVDEPAPCELWVLTLRNLGPEPRRLRSFSYAEFSFADAFNDMTNLDWAQHIVFSSCEDGIIRVGTKFNPLRYFFASSETPAGYTCDREDFVGRRRDLANPIVVETGKPSNAASPRGNSVGSLTHDIELGPGEERKLVFVMGATERPAEIERVVKRYSDLDEVSAAFQALRDDWAAYLGRFTVETPDADTNAMLNFWNQVQCRTTLYWSRFVSGYESGLGRGMGTRDSGQDTLGTMHTVPDHARRMLTTIWRMQFADGHTYHQFFPLTLEGGPGLAAEFPTWPQWFSDDHLWLIISVCAYLRETGDFDYLEQKVPYVDHAEETRLGAHAPGGGLHPRAPRAAQAAARRLLRLERHAQRRPRLGQGGERLDGHAVLPGDARSGRAVPRARPRRGRAALRRLCTTRWPRRSTSTPGTASGISRSFDDDGEPIGIAGAAHHAIDLIAAELVRPGRRRAAGASRAGHGLSGREAQHASSAWRFCGRPTTAPTLASRARPRTCPAPRRTAASSATPTPGPSSRRRCSATATRPTATTARSCRSPARTRTCTRWSRTRIRRTSAGPRIPPSGWPATPG